MLCEKEYYKNITININSSIIDNLWILLYVIYALFKSEGDGLTAFPHMEAIWTCQYIKLGSIIPPIESYETKNLS